jgi:hypothetical protein
MSWNSEWYCQLSPSIFVIHVIPCCAEINLFVIPVTLLELLRDVRKSLYHLYLNIFQSRFLFVMFNRQAIRALVASAMWLK